MILTVYPSDWIFITSQIHNRNHKIKKSQFYFFAHIVQTYHDKNALLRSGKDMSSLLPNILLVQEPHTTTCEKM